MASLRILIADDHVAVRRGLRLLLESQPGWEVCSEAANGREAVERAMQLEPEIVLLDMTMPELNGLEVTRLISSELPETRVILLTMHQSHELTGEVRRAGASAIVSKSEPQDLIAAIESLQNNRTQIHLAGSVVGRSRHIAALFGNEEELYGVIGPFSLEGLAQGEKVVHIIEPPGRDQHIQRLKEHAIDVDRAVSQRQLDLVSWEELYLRGGLFDQRATLERVRALLDDVAAEGFPAARVVANMEWALEERPGVRDLVEYEGRVDDLLRGFHDVVICAYDLRRFTGGVIIDVMRAHPAIIMKGQLRDNPLYSPT